MKKNDLYDKIKEAQEKIGNDAISMISEYLKLENFSDDGNVIKASCPFGHEDKTPSLIWNNEEKYFHCFSCSKNYGILDLLIEEKGSYLKAVNSLFKLAELDYELKVDDEENDEFFEDYHYPEEEKNTDRNIVEKYLAKRAISIKTLDDLGVKQDKHGNIAYELRDLNNHLLAIKYRPARAVKSNEPKMWWYEAKDANGKKLKSHCPLLYNMNRIDLTKPLLIVEGFQDCLACYEAGFSNVVSIPSGANDLKWVQFNYEFLEKFNEIVLWFDNDKAGKDGLNKTISRLGEYRCKIVSPDKDCEEKVKEYYHSLGTKSDITKTDANNVLMACGKKTVLHLIKNAKEIPSKKLKYLMDCTPTNVKDMEKVTTGVNGIDKLLYGNLFPCFTIWSGYAGCVDSDTEYFNGKEWKKISEYKDGEYVLEYDITKKEAILSRPNAYIKYPCDIMYDIENQNNFNMILSREHNVMWFDDGNNVMKERFENIIKRYGYKNKFNILGTVKYKSKEKLDDFDEYKEAEYFYDNINEKIVNKDLYLMSDLQRIKFLRYLKSLNEMKEKFYTKIKENADFLQFILLDNTGIVKIKKYYDKNKKEYFEIYNTKDIYYKYEDDEKDKNYKINSVKPKDGYKYCFTMPKGTLVLRKNGNIFCTYNSGKSSLANLVCLVSPVENNYKVFVYSGELDNGQLSDWIYSPIAGKNHTLVFKNENTRDGYAVSYEALKCIREYYRKSYILYDDEEGLDTSGDSILKEMENAYRKYDCRVFLIDNLMTISFDNIDADTRWETQKEFIKRIMSFTKKYNVNVNLIVHPKKPPSGGTVEHSVYDLHGASEIGNLCHRLIWIDRLSNDEEGYDIRVSVVKDRPSQAAGKSCKLYYDLPTRRIYTNDEELNKQYEWEHHYNVTYTKENMERLLCNQNIKSKNQINECDQF